MTFLETINAVLRRLREDSVTASNSNDYSKLIGDFVNQAIYDCEHAWDWNVLKETITITTAASDNLYDFHTADVKIISAINETSDNYMRVIPASLQHNYDYLTNLTNDSPYFYSFISKNGTSSQIKVTPTPDAVESLRFLCVKYTPSLLIDSTDDSDELVIPSHPIVLKAYALAVSERGEDWGMNFNETDNQANMALADAISLDAQLNHPDEVTWHAC